MGSRRQSLSEPAIRRTLLSMLDGEDPGRRRVVLEEVGLLHGSFRADVMVLGERLSAFEIKSEADTLQRLPHQARAYSAIFDEVSLVVTVRHLREALELIPDWWGVRYATDRGGETTLLTLRDVEPNPAPDARALAALLWKQEAEQILAAREAKPTSGNRSSLYDALAANLSWEELRETVAQALRVREGWLTAYSPR